MKTYVHGQTHARTNAQTLHAEMVRLRQEETLYRELSAQRTRLAQARHEFQQITGTDNPAELVRKRAMAQYGYDPDQATARLEKAAKEAYENSDTRTPKH